PETIRLTDMVSDIARTHRASATSADIKIETQLDNVAVNGNKETIRVIVDNLLSNAVKFSPRGGTVSITLARDEEFVHIDIEDDGPGVQEPELDKIFAPFFQGSAQAREHYPSTGLGLAIARDYAEQAGGNLKVIDCKKGQGACFRLSLPRR
ncbi:MAG: ATP-binding protein, partial [Pseudohongiella sp.]